jgi:thiol-disulfide isomerase/thioredoxin
MKLSFENEVSDSDISKVDSLLGGTKTTVLLNHAHYCGHCHAMRSEFELFKQRTNANIVEIESSSLGSFQRKPTIYNKIKSDEGIYFPMIIVYVARTSKKPLKKLYKGPRTAEGLHSFIKESEAKLNSAAAKKPAVAKKPKRKTI